MYIRVTKNQRGEAYYHLVESYREGDKVKQRSAIGGLGNVKDGKLEELADAISKHLDYVNIFNLAKSVDVKDTYIYGPLYVLQGLLKSSGIFSVLKKIQTAHPRVEFDPPEADQFSPSYADVLLNPVPNLLFTTNL